MTAALLILLGGLAVLGLVVFVRWDDARAWRVSLTTYRLILPQSLTTADVAAWLAHVVATTHASGLAVHVPPALGLEVTAGGNGLVGHAGGILLRKLADRQGDSAAFTKRLLVLRAQHQRKPSLLDRLDMAGLPR